MNIGFDLDKVFIDTPPLIPNALIDRLYRKKTKGTLAYRIPGPFEQKIRILSHTPFLRHSIKKNLSFLEKLAKEKKNNLFLVSSRFHFLKSRTDSLVKKYHLDTLFTHLYFNYKDEQPHIFKNAIIKDEKIEKYVDDDLPLLKYLATNNPKTQFFWLNTIKMGKLATNIFAIKNLSQMLE